MLGNDTNAQSVFAVNWLENGAAKRQNDPCHSGQGRGFCYIAVHTLETTDLDTLCEATLRLLQLSWIYSGMQRLSQPHSSLFYAMIQKGLLNCAWYKKMLTLENSLQVKKVSKHSCVCYIGCYVLNEAILHLKQSLHAHLFRQFTIHGFRGREQKYRWEWWYVLQQS